MRDVSRRHVRYAGKMSIAFEPIVFEEQTVGLVRTAVRISNAYDVRAANRGELPATQVRSILLDCILVDTGATHLSLPQDMIEALDLDRGREISLQTATGPATANYYDGALVQIEGRTALLPCVSLPPGSLPLLGVVPLESLGFEPDLQRQELRMLPENGPTTYIAAF